MTKLKEIPREYERPCPASGTLERMDVPDYSDAVIYLPYGYKDSDGRYPTLYLLHDGWGNQDSFFSADNGKLKHMVDHMIQAREIKPLIIVTPTYYPPGRKGGEIEYSDEAVRDFEGTLVRKIVPAVDDQYRTITGNRNRCLGGFAMGAVATWRMMMMEGTRYFYWYLPMCGDSWICGRRGGGKHPEQTAGLLASAMQGESFYIHAYTGTRDTSFPSLSPQIQAMRQYSDVFRRNLKYSVLQEGTNDHQTVRRYIYNALPELF